MTNDPLNSSYTSTDQTYFLKYENDMFRVTPRLSPSTRASSSTETILNKGATRLRTDAKSLPTYIRYFI